MAFPTGALSSVTHSTCIRWLVLCLPLLLPSLFAAPPPPTPQQQMVSLETENARLAAALTAAGCENRSLRHMNNALERVSSRRGGWWLIMEGGAGGDLWSCFVSCCTVLHSVLSYMCVVNGPSWHSLTSLLFACSVLASYLHRTCTVLALYCHVAQALVLRDEHIAGLQVCCL